MKTINPFVCAAAIAVVGLSFNASADEFSAPRLGVVCETPAQAKPGVGFETISNGRPSRG